MRAEACRRRLPGRRRHLGDVVEARLEVAQAALGLGNETPLPLHRRRHLLHARLQLLRALPNAQHKTAVKLDMQRV